MSASEVPASSTLDCLVSVATEAFSALFLSWIVLVSHDQWLKGLLDAFWLALKKRLNSWTAIFISTLLTKLTFFLTDQENISASENQTKTAVLIAHMECAFKTWAF